MPIREAPKMWKGKSVALGEELNIEAVMVHEILEGGVSGEYYIKGRVLRMPTALHRWIGGNLTVDFGEFKIKMGLLDRKGIVVSSGMELNGRMPEELWVISGGEAL